jgi:hypothetical protein
MGVASGLILSRRINSESLTAMPRDCQDLNLVAYIFWIAAFIVQKNVEKWAKKMKKLLACGSLRS